MSRLADNRLARAVARVPATVRRKRLVAFAGIVSLLVVLGVLGLRELSASNDRVLSLGELPQRIETYRELQLDTDQLGGLFAARNRLIDFAGGAYPNKQPPDGTAVAVTDGTIQSVLTRLGPFTDVTSLGYVPPRGERGLLTEIQSEFGQLRLAVSSIVAKDQAGEYSAYDGQLRPDQDVVTNLESHADQLVSMTQADTASLIAHNQASYLDSQRLVIGAAAASILLALLLGQEYNVTRRKDSRLSREEPATMDQRPAPNTFVREGDFWSLTYEGVVVRLKDSKGLRDIARLLATPGREVAAVDLASETHWNAGHSLSAIADLGLGVEAGVGDTLDAEARTQYRSRLADLEAEILEDEANNDAERASRARDEREFLLAELRAAVGLGGRSRRLLDPAERARKAVRERVHDAITHLEKVHHGLGRHLRRSVRTGGFCIYDPADSTTWQLSADTPPPRPPDRP